MVKKQLLWGVLLAGVLGFGCSHSGQFSQRPKSSKDGLKPTAKHFLQQKGGGKSLPTFDIPVEVNDRVLAWVDFFQGTNHERFERYLQRSGRYVTWMRQMLKEEGLPQDLVYLALIESGFATQAYSRAKASGPWQFIRSTGNHYGLSSNGWMDERRDPEKATRAAAQYLKKLYNEFGDWYLAMAAYNAGEGKIHQAIQRSGTQDFWKISAPGTRYLKAETKDYVPKFIAAALIAKSPERFGFNNIAYHEPLAFETVEVEGPIDFEIAAQLAGVPPEQIELLNPELHRHITPPNVYQLKIPQGTKSKFELAYAQLPPEKRVMMLVHQVKRGESLRSIAKRYGVSTKILVAANDLHGRHPHIKAGMVLTIPRGKAALVMASAEKETRRYSYKVKRKDSLKKIANRFGVTVAQLKRENHIKSNSVHAGQHLHITKKATVNTADMLAYNKRSKQVHMNGVEYLIRKQQNMGATEEATVSDTSKEVTDVDGNVSPESVSVDVPPETAKKDVVTPSSIQESDLQEPSTNENVEAVATPVTTVERKAVVQKHVVKRGESLIKIAKKYQVRVIDLKEWNHLKNTKLLRAGQTLVVHQHASVSKKKPSSKASHKTPRLSDEEDTSNANGETPRSAEALSPQSNGY